LTSSPRQEGDGPEPAEQALILEVALTAGDPVSGTVGVAGRSPALPFHGWMDLMSAINTLRTAPGLPYKSLQIAEFPDVTGVRDSLAWAANEDDTEGSAATARGRPGYSGAPWGRARTARAS